MAGDHVSGRSEPGHGVSQAVQRQLLRPLYGKDIRYPPHFVRDMSPFPSTIRCTLNSMEIRMGSRHWLFMEDRVLAAFNATRTLS